MALPAPMPMAGAGTAPGQPPMGPQNVQMPTPNRGAQAAAMAQINWAIRLLEQALPMVGATSDVGQACMKAISSLAKLVPAGASAPGVERTGLEQLMLRAKQEEPMMALMRGQGGGGAPGGPPPNAAAPPMPPQGV